ncbi:MAG: hypothetical protein FD149_500 [Rhodospirillaceae bacterium]|nr:MAG: hypothetical protein FD149_500 [Rhodospirillaceae bacterium]
MKRLLIIVGMLGALLGSSAAVVILFDLVPAGWFAVPAEKQAEAPPPSQPAAAYVDLSTLVIPVMADGRVKTQFMVEIRFAVEPQAKAAVEGSLNALQDAIIRDMHAYLPKHLETRMTVDLVLLRQRLHAVATRIVGAGKIRDVLFQSALNL